MGRVDEAKANRVWFYIWIAYLVMATSSDIHPALLPWVSTGLLAGWYFSLGRKQTTYVKETLRDGYERKPWKGPLLIALCCLIVLPIVGAIVLTVARTLAFRLQ